MPSGKGVDPSPVHFESSLERDFFVLLEFNVHVLRWDAQPVRIDLGPSLGTYVPDVLVTYGDASDRANHPHQVLYEVKYRDELRRKWASLRPRYRSTLRFARAQGWRFKIITEREIRTELLWNAKFLLPYHHDPASEGDCKRLLDALDVVGETTPTDLLAKCSSDRLVQARLLTSLWYLISFRMIATDLTQRLKMDSRIWRYA